eukprot:scaffold109158_cov40-Attheya_sp.AAC.2
MSLGNTEKNLNGCLGSALDPPFASRSNESPRCLTMFAPGLEHTSTAWACCSEQKRGDDDLVLVVLVLAVVGLPQASSRSTAKIILCSSSGWVWVWV